MTMPGIVVKNPHANAGAAKKHRFQPWVRKIPWRRKSQPTPVFLPGKFHGQSSLIGYGPGGCKELDDTEHALSLSLSLSHTHTHTHTHTPPFSASYP